MADAVRLDDLYKMVAHIYSDKNLSRTASATFAHFVEVCGMLTIHDRKKKREAVTVTDALCKALGWYFPLMAKFNVRSVEDLVYRKFPYACPYCRLAPHRDADCKLVRGTSSTVDHAAVSVLYRKNAARKPVTLNDWQAMFQEIYPREADDRGRSTIGLLEELGELAEAIRVYENYPKYFLGEAADTFSYIMGIANEHSLRLRQDSDIVFSFEEEFLARYPGLCIQCGSRVCVCPSVPEATVGRMAKELEVGPDEMLFIENREAFSDAGRSISHRVLERVGGYPGLTARFPFDRGDANHALITLCLKLAEATNESRPELSEKLRAEALRISASATYAGSPKKPFDIGQLLVEIRSAWSELDKELQRQIKSDGDLVEQIVELIETRRVLFVFCSPIEDDPIRVSGELRAILEAVKLGSKGSTVVVEPLPAATADDLRRAVLSRRWDIVHFSGHATDDVLVFETADGRASEVPLSAVAELLTEHGNVKCVVLNACSSAAGLKSPIGDITVGMNDTIDDEAAIEFSRGFYDALAAGKKIEEAIPFGINAVKLKGLDPTPIKVLTR